MRKVLVVVLATAAALTAAARASAASDTAGAPRDSTHRPQGPPMSASTSLGLPMTRDGSGTGWNPDVSSMYGWMYHARRWMYMVHGSVYLRYTAQDVFHEGGRGGAKWDAPNWIMGMAQRRVGEKGLLHFNLMMSADRLTEGGAGYPLLFQTGESWNDKPLVDRQHPHDLFAEVSASYAYAIDRDQDVFVYIGYPGEPALGPVTFMHRPSAFFDPDAPVGHHWQDATHITFGVATLGYRLKDWKLEVSDFTGREPDENRYNFDKPRMDSYSARLSFAPAKNYTFQVSEGYIKSPELLEPQINVWRTTASAQAGYDLAGGRALDLCLVWGMNKNEYEDPNQSILAEAAYRVRTWAWYTRYEWVQKTGEELRQPPAIYSLNALTLGLNKELLHTGELTWALGAQTTLDLPDQRLKTAYGNLPIGGEVFLQVRPRLMHMGHRNAKKAEKPMNMDMDMKM